MPQELRVEYIPLEALREYEGNAKIHDEANIEAIKASIERFGNCDPIGVWTNPDGEYEIVEGHGRKMALTELGHTHAPCIVLDHLTDEERRAYTLAHNQTTLMSGFDMEKLGMELDALADFAMEDFGFGDFQMEDKTYEEVEEVEPEEDVPTRCKPGDLWVLGDHRLLCGDSTDPEAIAKLMDGAKADLWLTDPPYNVAYEGKTKEALTIDNDDMSDGQFEDLLLGAFTAASEAMRPGAAFYIWHASRTQRQFEDALNKAGLEVRQQLIWVKNIFTLSRQDHQWRHEPCFYGWKDGAPHFWNADRKQTTVWEEPEADLDAMKKDELLELAKNLVENIRSLPETVLRFDKPSRNAEHPTMKPVKLMAYQIENSTKAGQTVLDSFGGSGSTLVACEQLGRRCRTMELDPHYCDVIIERWERLTERKAVRL